MTPEDDVRELRTAIETRKLGEVPSVHYAAYMAAMDAYRAATEPDRIRRLLDRLEAAEKDAGRYRAIREDFSAGSVNIDGNHAWVYRRNFSLKGPTLDAAIDAMKAAT